MPETLDYARKPRPRTRLPDWKVAFPSAMVVIPAGFLLLVSGGLVVSDGALGISPIVFGVSLLSLICELLCMSRVGLAPLAIVIEASVLASWAAINLYRYSRLFDAEPLLLLIAMAWLLIVIAGHVRWFVILRSENAHLRRSPVDHV